MVEVEVKLHSVLNKYAQGQTGFETLYLADGMTINDLLVTLGIQNGEVGPILMDGKLVEKSNILIDGTLIEIYPIFGGG